ncbi:hypothetical protein ACHAXA_001821 [Cyclostephanos tholiformis]|uniref:Uncharacterized protein n=1 Tax=Cyclostephanos tholiformis TaxID=382380 RepID=A0ABD3SDS5_9STRA
MKLSLGVPPGASRPRPGLGRELSGSVSLVSVRDRTLKNSILCRRMGGWTDGRTDGRTEGRMDRHSDRQTDGQKDRRTEGQKDKRTDGQTDRQTIVSLHIS